LRIKGSTWIPFIKPDITSGNCIHP
jgi:hypothetical protein